jgi:hypothetical protein
MSSPAVSNFMRQQGFAEEPADACDMHFVGLYFQPRIVFAAILVAILLQSGALHLAISAILWWNTLLPAWNPFELAYNRLIARKHGGAPLLPAPGPRRFAQGMAAAFNLGAWAGLWLGHPGIAWGLEGALVAAFTTLLFGRFCLGAYVYHVLRGRLAFANRTLPWARPE